MSFDELLFKLVQVTVIEGGVDANHAQQLSPYTANAEDKVLRTQGQREC